MIEVNLEEYIIKTIMCLVPAGSPMDHKPFEKVTWEQHMRPMLRKFVSDDLWNSVNERRPLGAYAFKRLAIKEILDEGGPEMKRKLESVGLMQETALKVYDNKALNSAVWSKHLEKTRAKYHGSKSTATKEEDMICDNEALAREEGDRPFAEMMLQQEKENHLPVNNKPEAVVFPTFKSHWWKFKAFLKSDGCSEQKIENCMLMVERFCRYNKLEFGKLLEWGDLKVIKTNLAMIPFCKDWVESIVECDVQKSATDAYEILIRFFLAEVLPRGPNLARGVNDEFELRRNIFKALRSRLLREYGVMAEDKAAKE